MAEIQIPNVRQESTVLLPTRLKDNGVTVNWSSLANIKAYMYSDAQRVIAGKCTVEVDGENSAVLNVTYPATRPQYLGVNSLLVRCKYQGREKTYDVPVLNFVERTAEATGVTVLDDPVVDVELEVDEVSTSLLDGAIAAALDAAIKAEEAAEEAQRIIDEGRGPEGKSAYQVAVDNGFEGTEEEWLESLKGEDGKTPGWDDFSAEDKAAIIAEADAALQPALDTKQDVIQDLATIRSGAAAGAEASSRPYDSQNPNGMGYLVLEKDKTFASQVTEANTIYEIRYEFDLNNSAVTIPVGCKLKFAGGKIVNGTIVGKNTSIDAGVIQIFGITTTLSGTWDVLGAKVEWFGAKGDGVTNDYPAFAKALTLKDISLLAKTYRIGSRIVMAGNQTISGVYGKTIIAVDSGVDGVRVGHSCTLKNLSIKVTGSASAVVVDSEHVGETFDSGNLSYIHTANINITNVFIKSDSESANGYGVSIVSNGTGQSFWQVRCSNLKIVGYFAEAIHLSAENSGWLTDVSFADIKVSGCAVGVRLSNTSTIVASLGRVTFYNLSMQFNSSRTLYFAKVERAQRVSFVNCEPFDFPDANKPFYITGSSEGVSIIDCVNGPGNPVDMDGVLTSALADNYPYKIIKSSRDASMPVFNGGTYFGDRLSQGTITNGEFFSLPSGIFYFSSANAANLGTFFNLPSIPGATFSYGSILVIRRFEQGLFADLILNSHGIYFNGHLSRFFTGIDSSTADSGISNLWDSLQPHIRNYSSEADFLSACQYSELGMVNGKLVRRASATKTTDASGRKNFGNYGSSVPAITGVVYADTGQQFFYTTQRRPIYLVQSAGIWVDALGRPYNRKLSGTTSERPTDAQLAVGDTYFDSTLGKPIWYKGNSEWVDATGATV